MKKNLFILLILSPFLFLSVSEAQIPRQKRYMVLIINSYHKGYLWTDTLVDSISTTLSSHIPELDLRVEYMDTKRYKGVKYLEIFLELIKRKYSSDRPNLIIVTDDNAFYFVRAYYEDLFNGVPVIFCGVNYFTDDMLEGLEDHFTGIVQIAGIQDTIELIPSFHPKVRNIVVVHDGTLTGMGYRVEVKKVEKRFPGQRFVYLSGAVLTTDEMLNRLKDLSSDSVVLLCIWVKGKEEKYVSWDRIYPEITTASPVPVYGVVDYMLQYGVVGGKMNSAKIHGRAASMMAVMIYRGKRVRDIPINRKGTATFMFDYRQLKRWDISKKKLPEGSIIVNRPPPTYTFPKEWIWASAGFIAIISLFIIFLLIERKNRLRSQRELFEREKRYRTLFENSLDAIFLSDEDGNIIDANDAWYKMFGYKKEEMEKVNLRALCESEEVLDRWKREISEAGFVKDYECKAIRKDGMRMEVVINSVATKYSEGRTIFQNILRDITEQHRLLNALRKSEEKFSKAFRSSPEPICICTLEKGIFMEANDAFFDLFKLKRDEVIGKDLVEVGFWANLEERTSTIKKIQKDGRIINYERSYKRRDGKTIFYIWSAEQIEFEGKICLISILKDVTERIEKEIVLRRSEQRIRAVFQAIPDPMVVYNIEGKVEYLNHAFESVFGWKIEELKGDRIPFVPDDQVEITGQKIEEIFRTKRPIRMETQRLTKDGRALDIELSASLVLDEYGNPTGMVVNLRDITERKRLEAQLLQAQKMEAIGRLTGSIAHDFNNILTSIMGFSELSLLKLPQDSPIGGYLKGILDSSKKASTLIRQLLAFSRKEVIQPINLNLNSIIKGMEGMLKRVLGEDIEFVTYFEKGVKNVRLDPSQLEQVIMNLCVNARDAMPGGGRLTIETCNVILDERYAKTHGVEIPTGPYVMMAITDTGSGIDEDIKDKIFDPFFTTKPKGTGTGLGLSTVYGIVKQNNGYIWCYSEKGKGATFKIYFPAVEEAEDKEREASILIKDLRGTETLLVVEDDDMLREMMIDYLENHGYKVVSARDGIEALKISSEIGEKIDLLVTDVIMPQLGGKELYDRLKAERPALKCIFISGYPENAIVKHGVLSPGINFLQKPFKLEVLLKFIREVLKKGNPKIIS